jgi:hypothetical protein
MATDPLVLAVRKLFPISYRAATFSFSDLCYCFKDEGTATFLKLGTYLPCSVTTDDRNLNLNWVALLSHSVRYAMRGFLFHDVWSLHMQVRSCEGQGQVYVQDSSCQIVLLQNAPLANCVSWPTLQFLTTNFHCIELKLNAWPPLSPYFTLHLFKSFLL